MAFSGTKTRHIPNPNAVPVQTSAGEFLVFQIDAGGPDPNFVQAGSVFGVIMHESRFPGPQSRYVWNFLRSSTDQHNFEVITTGFQFFRNADYRFRVFVVDASLTPVRTALDIEWTGGVPSDFDAEDITVILG